MLPNRKKTPSPKTAAPKKQKAPSPRLDVDFPREGEEVLSGHYAVRVSAEGAEDVEVSVNDGPWQPCRAAAGFFWYDWAPSEPGTHVILVRWRRGKFRSKPVALRNCSVREANLN